MKLPIVSGFDAVKALTKAGFEIKRRKGSHVVLQKGIIVLSVPLHRTLKKGTLRAIIRQAGLTVEEFLKLLS
jgi:predicted RNA binding protein YcfA (HicA-like mRNA interferase family)